MNCEDGTGCLSQWASGFGPVLSVEDCPEPLFSHAGEKNSEQNECEACRGKASGGGGGERSVSCWHPVLSRFDRAFNNQIKIQENRALWTLQLKPVCKTSRTCSSAVHGWLNVTGFISSQWRPRTSFPLAKSVFLGVKTLVRLRNKEQYAG